MPSLRTWGVVQAVTMSFPNLSLDAGTGLELVPGPRTRKWQLHFSCCKTSHWTTRICWKYRTYHYPLLESGALRFGRHGNFPLVSTKKLVYPSFHLPEAIDSSRFVNRCDSDSWASSYRQNLCSPKPAGMPNLVATHYRGEIH